MSVTRLPVRPDGSYMPAGRTIRKREFDVLESSVPSWLEARTTSTTLGTSLDYSTAGPRTATITAGKELRTTFTLNVDSIESVSFSLDGLTATGSFRMGLYGASAGFYWDVLSSGMELRGQKTGNPLATTVGWNMVDTAASGGAGNQKKNLGSVMRRFKWGSGGTDYYVGVTMGEMHEAVQLTEMDSSLMDVAGTARFEIVAIGGDVTFEQIRLQIETL